MLLLYVAVFTQNHTESMCVVAQCEREAVWIRMKMLSKRDCWLISSKKKEDRTVKKRVAAVVERTDVSGLKYQFIVVAYFHLFGIILLVTNGNCCGYER
jgi:hypothetical protein